MTEIRAQHYPDQVDNQIMSGPSGSIGRLTASAIPLLLEASSDLREFAVQRWLFTSSFVEDRQTVIHNLARLAGATTAVNLHSLSAQARRIWSCLRSQDADARSFIRISQHLFSAVLDDAETVRQIANSERALSWFSQSFLEEAVHSFNVVPRN